MSMFDHLAYAETTTIVRRALRACIDKDGLWADDGFVAITQDTKHMVVYEESHGLSYVLEFERDHKPVQADAFVRLTDFPSDFDEMDNILKWLVPLSEEQKSIVAAALKASLCDVKAFDPVTPVGKVAPVRLCPMGAKVSNEALDAALVALNRMKSVYPLSFTEMDSSPVMALRAVAYGGTVSISGHSLVFRMRITACIPMEVHRVKDFNEMVHDVFGYKREDD